MAFIGLLIILCSFLYDQAKKNEVMKKTAQMHPKCPVFYDHRGNTYWRQTGQRCVVTRVSAGNKVMDYATGKTIAIVPVDKWLNG